MHKSGYKVAIIGTGNVGTAGAFAVISSGNVSELVLVDINEKRVAGLAHDMGQANAFHNNVKFMATTDIQAIEGADVVVISAGARVMPGQTRLDLAKSNLEMVEQIVPGMIKAAPNAVVMCISNPVDVVTHRVAELSGLPEGRVFGTGTTLDSIRFRWNLSHVLNIDPQSIHADLLGEHGDSSFPYLSGAMVGGRKLTEVEGISEQQVRECFELARKGANKIRETIGFTSYGIGMIMSDLLAHIFHDRKVVLPLSVKVHDLYGVDGITLSLPAVLGKNGVERIIRPVLNEEEQIALRNSADVLKKYLAK